MSSSYYALNLKINNLFSYIRQAIISIEQLNNTSIIPVTSQAGVLLFDAQNLPFTTWSTTLLENITQINFSNLKVNGLYTIYMTIGPLPITISKISCTNSLNGDLFCAPLSVFVLTVYYDGVNTLVSLNAFT